MPSTEKFVKLEKFVVLLSRSNWVYKKHEFLKSHEFS